MFVEMAEIVRAVGLRGEIKLMLSGDFEESILGSRFLRLRTEGGEETEVTVERARWKGETLVVKLDAIGDRDAAEAAVGGSVGFRESDYDLPDFPRPDEPMPFVYQDLRVETEEGVSLGRVREVRVLPANLVLVVEGGGRELLVPIIPPVVRELDRESGVLRIHPLEGLFDDEVEPD